MGAVTDFLFPREKIFFKMFNDAAKNSLNGVSIFNEFINNFTKLNANEKKEYLRKIEEIEDRGDRIVHLIHEKLNNSFITPIDKEDIHELSSTLDDIIDLIYSSTKQIVLYEIKDVDECIIELTRIIQEGSKEVIKLIEHLANSKLAKQSLVKINKLENDADDILEKYMAELYKSKRNPIDVIKLKEVYYNLELVTDKIEDISDVIQSVIIKHG